MNAIINRFHVILLPAYSYKRPSATSDVNKTKFLRPRPRPGFHATAVRTIHVLLIIKTVPVSVFKRLLAVLNIIKVWHYSFNYQYNGTACMFTDNKYTRQFATHKNAQSQLCDCVHCLNANQKSQRFSLTTALICIRFLLHFVITSSHSKLFGLWPSLCGRMNSPPWLNTRSAEAEQQATTWCIVRVFWSFTLDC